MQMLHVAVQLLRGLSREYCTNPIGLASSAGKNPDTAISRQATETLDFKVFGASNHDILSPWPESAHPRGSTMARKMLL